MWPGRKCGRVVRWQGGKGGRLVRQEVEAGSWFYAKLGDTG